MIFGAHVVVYSHNDRHQLYFMCEDLAAAPPPPSSCQII